MSTKIKGAINIGVIVTLGLSILGGLITGVVELTQTRAIAEEAKASAEGASIQTANLSDSLTNVRLNIARICIGLKIKCIEN